MNNSIARTIADVEFMAFSSEQLEVFLENTSSELKNNLSCLDALEDDPIPIKLVDKSQPEEGKHKNVIEVEAWEELEPMPEGEARIMTRQFLYVDSVEVEVCSNTIGSLLQTKNS